jgi:hypothetical protein
MPQSQTTAERIDATHQANQHPDDASKSEIATALEGRRLHDPQLLQKFDGICARCDEKNDKRRMAGVDPVDPSLDHGDAVTIHAIHTDDDDELRAPHWHIRGVLHTHHPQVSFDNVITSGTSLVRARCELHKQDQRYHIVDVEVTERSRTDAGPDQSVVEQRRQRFVDHSDEHPDDMMVIDRDPEDPPAHWPQLDREWLIDLIASKGPLTEQVYQITVDPPAGDQPDRGTPDIDGNCGGSDGR